MPELSELGVLVCGCCGDHYIPQRRSARNRFCSRTCKEQRYIADGRHREPLLRAYYKRNYGLSLEEVAELRDTVCAICGTTEWGGRFNQPHIDHDHRTGEVRGVLCSNCNTGLGKFRDNPELLSAAARYLIDYVR